MFKETLFKTVYNVLAVFTHVGRTGASQGCDGINKIFRNFLANAHGREQFFRDLSFLVGCVFSTREHRGSATYQCRRVRHHSDHRCSFRQRLKIFLLKTVRFLFFFLCREQFTHLIVIVILTHSCAD